MTSTTALLLSHLVLATALGADPVGMPLGMPPLAEDPLMSRVAPEKCEFYWTSSGTAAPRADSKAEAERMLAEPAVQKFVADTAALLKTAIANQVGDDPQTKKMADQGLSVVRSLLMRPLCYYSSSPIETSDPTTLDAALVVNIDGQQNKMQEMLTALQQMALMGQPPQTLEAGGSTWNNIPLPLPALETPLQVMWTIKGRYLIIAANKTAAENLVARARTAPPAWYTQLRSRMPIERMSTFSYSRHLFNADSITKELGPQQEQAKAAIASLGLTDITGVATISGLDGKYTKSFTYIDTNSSPRGLFSITDGKPLTAADLQAIPQDALLAIAGRATISRLIPVIREAVSAYDPQRVPMMDQPLAMSQQMLGADLEKQILPAFGDVWTIHIPNGAGPMAALQTTLTVTVKDHATLDALVQRLAQMAPPAGDGAGPPGMQGPSLKVEDHAGTKIYSAVIPGQQVSPALALTKDRLYLSVTVQGVKAALSRATDSAESLASVPQVAAMLNSSSDKPFKFVYVDTKTVFHTVYPMVQGFAPMAEQQLAGMGIQVKLPQLPDANAIASHLEPSILSVAKVSTGYRMESVSTIPIANASELLTGGAMGLGGAFLLGQSAGSGGPAATPPALEDPGDSDNPFGVKPSGRTPEQPGKPEPEENPFGAGSDENPFK